jgi:hypothetical protein
MTIGKIILIGKSTVNEQELPNKLPEGIAGKCKLELGSSP